MKQLACLEAFKQLHDAKALTASLVPDVVLEESLGLVTQELGNYRLPLVLSFAQHICLNLGDQSYFSVLELQTWNQMITTKQITSALSDLELVLEVYP